jgi:uncharacterized membrane protein
MESSKIKNPDVELPEEDQCPELNKKDVIALLHQSIQHHSGPLPSPQILKEYNEILPDAAERIFNMAEKAQVHYETTEQRLVELEIKKVSRGQFLAFIIAITGMAGAVVCAFLGQVTIGSIIGGATLISIVPNFISGKRKKKREADDVEPELESLLEKKESE